jgi:hypothetical protein
MTPSIFEIKLRHNRRSSQLLKVKASKMDGKDGKDGKMEKKNGDIHQMPERWNKDGKMGTSINWKETKGGGFINCWEKMGALIN